MKTTYIITEIYDRFAATYKNATPFIDSGALWDFWIDTIKNPITITIFRNGPYSIKT